MEDLTMDSTDISWDMTEIEAEGQNVMVDQNIQCVVENPEIKCVIKC